MGSIFVGMALGISVAKGAGDADFVMVENRQPLAVILLGEKATFIERHAAGELAKYVEKATGARLEITSNRAGLNAKNIVLLGRAETHPMMAEFAANGLCDLSPERPGLDGFVIKTVAREGRNYLLIGGSMDRGALYGVYHFLEKALNVGFFWEGERVPRQDTVRLGKVDIVERPFFKIRQYPQACVFVYNSRQWDLEDWKREIDWMCKHRFNHLLVPWESQSPLADVGEIVKYARSVGLTPIFMLNYIGVVTGEFHAKHPGARYVSIRWGEEPAQWALHPDDPLFLSELRKNVARYMGKYGSGNVYSIDPYGEQAFDLSPGEIDRLKMSFARKTSEGIKLEDREGRIFMWTWPFSSCRWSKDSVRKFLECLPDDDFYICDSYAETWPVYKKYDYFSGKAWGFSSLRFFGGDDALKGNLADLIFRVKDVAADPKAGRCMAFHLDPEVVHYNSLYHELETKLAWNPGKVTLDDFLRDYALRRYGRERMDGMLAALRELAESVYGGSPGSEPLYQFPRYEGCEGNLYLGQYSYWDFSASDVYTLSLARACRRSINNALRLQETLQRVLAQKDASNPCYCRDLADIARQGLAEIFNARFFAMQRAFQERQIDPLKREIAALKTIMQGVEELVFHSGLHRLRPLEEKVSRHPALAKRELAEIRDSLTTFHRQRWLLDYQGKDFYELIKYYYRPRLSAYLDAVARTAEDGKWSMKSVGIDRILENAGKQWAACSFGPEPGGKDLFGAVEKACQLLRDYRPQRAPFLVEGEELKIRNVQWEDRFAEVSDWKVTHFAGGEMVSDGRKAVVKAPGKNGIVYGRDLDLSVETSPRLNFRFNKASGGNVVLWMTWLDAGGKTHRNRVWQDCFEGIDEGVWLDIQLDLQQMFLVLNAPAKLTRVEIENTAETVTQWERMAFGK
ncbi:MAG: alpha-N-acetylglucosaminidase TIM-barrel domain-containing protein [Verrucomicrobiae bacterium]|nr:alpha-N-acetylglucosaminidase TIM-barrel domain-containing protein [Verrucomicrobiae bacterium]